MKHKIVLGEETIGRFIWEFPDDMSRAIDTMQKNAKEISPQTEQELTDVFLSLFERLLISYLRLLAGAVITNQGQKTKESAGAAARRITRFYKSLSLSNKRRFDSIISDWHKRNNR